MNVQFIETDGKRTYAILSIEHYEHLLNQLENSQDLRDIERTKNDELLPGEFVYKLCDAETPLPVWREYRGVTQAQLAEKSGVQQAYIAQIESGTKTGSVETLKSLAEALDLTIDDLV